MLALPYIAQFAPTEKFASRQKKLVFAMPPQVSFTVGSDGGYFFKTALNLKDSYAKHFESLRFKEGFTLYPG
jgi:hypothetical protein